MFSTIPVSWRDGYSQNVTLTELNNDLVLLHAPAIVIFTVLMVIGVLGNVVVLIIFIPSPSSLQKVCILWLAVIDLVACCVGIPILLVSMYLPYHFPSEKLCQSVRFMHVFLVSNAIFILVFIAVERQRTLGKLGQRTSVTRTNVICCIACFAGGVIAAPSVIVYGNRTVQTGVYNMTGTECFVQDHLENALLAKLYFVFQLVLTVVCLVIMIIMYVKIGRMLKWHKTFRKKSLRLSTSSIATSSSRLSTNGRHAPSTITDSHNSCQWNSRRSKSHKPRQDADTISDEMTKMFFAVTVIFFFSFIPHLIIIVMTQFNKKFSQDMTSSDIVFYNIFLRSFVINNVTNPIVYLVFMLNFRKACRKLFCRCFHVKETYSVT
ncbi:NPFF2-like protein [Mya arenaria]|uniref:NPFF2-like protein n=1 Tax=Mya arenaria TaxID=6604 RepID=A0ABY7G8Q8_MYAAR|nr:probable G-protein coupled receptor 45 [Mya arenaria]XP_052787694.1 probable G-protein coupled receptor 45 [Mya arenaria]WAR29451.1 NPFF2-like protein [Mya arenaria]